MFSPEFFINNRRNLRSSTIADLIVLSANGLVQKSADTTYPFRQDSNFWYTTGLKIAGAVVVIDAKNNTEFLILPERQNHRDLWEGAIDHREIAALSGINSILDSKQGWLKLKDRLKDQLKF